MKRIKMELKKKKKTALKKIRCWKRKYNLFKIKYRSAIHDGVIKENTEIDLNF